jgi:hypothetical protein
MTSASCAAIRTNGSSTMLIMDKDYGNKLLPPEKRFEKTDSARTTAESADDFLEKLNALLDSDAPKE